tara:strand:+ start:4177 stop:4572 length:396 start_codon:yes stop_codon:yes gene_type:complete
MEIEGNIVSGGRIEIDVDLDDIKEEFEIMDSDDVEQIVRDYLDNHDFGEEIDIDGKAEELLLQYDGMNNPCGLGQSFEKAVWWAMSRHTLFNEDVVRKIVREELRAILNMGVSRLDVQSKYKRIDDDVSNT